MKINRSDIRKFINESIRSILLEEDSPNNISYKRSIMIGKDLIKNILMAQKGNYALTAGCQFGDGTEMDGPFSLDDAVPLKGEGKSLVGAMDFKNPNSYLYLTKASVENIVENIIVGKEVKQSGAIRTPGSLGLEVLKGEYKGLLMVITGGENIDLYKQSGIFNLSNIKGNVDIRIGLTLPDQVPNVFYEKSDGYSLPPDTE